jgi:apolipoprotein N-acyltransferase
VTPETTAGAATLAERMPSLSGRRRAALSALCGAGLTLAQAPVGFWPVLFLAWPVLAALIARAPGLRAATACGFWAGLGFFSTGLYWVGEAFLVEAARHWWYAPLMPAAVLALAAVCAAFWAGGFALARWLWRDGWRGAVALALAMTAAELARGAALTGFPWALQAYAWIDAPVFQTASFLGADALSGLTVFVASLPAFAARRAPWPALGALTCVAVAWVYGAARLEGAPAPAPDAPVIRLVQPNTAQVDKWAPENRGPIFERLLRLTAAPAERAPTLVVWPEVAVTFLFDESPEAQARAARAAGDAALALGAIRRDGAGAFRNSLLLYGPAGEALAVYDKIRLTPFGEYLPYKWVLSRIGLGVLGEGFSNLSPGDASGPSERWRPAARRAVDLLRDHFSEKHTGGGARRRFHYTSHQRRLVRRERGAVAASRSRAGARGGTGFAGGARGLDRRFGHDRRIWPYSRRGAAEFRGRA